MTTPPRRINDRYDLGETLGFGGMSEVHLARDTRLSRDVAIKILRADLARDPSFYERFRREAQNAASLNHPTIVQVYDTGEADTPGGPLPYIVMEYVDGETLRDVLRRDGTIAPQAAMTWMADVCAALDFSHRNGIVHRDMKPANVMLTRTGEIKVMDFGIARAMSDPSAGMTQTAAVIGTAQYLSPEQARGESVDARSDVYAAGCVLFELLTGQPPFQGDSPVSVAYQHVREDPPTPSSILDTVPPELDSITLKALSKNPANRYQTAGEMRQDLIRVLAGRKPEAPMVLSDEERDALLTEPTKPRRAAKAAPAAAAAAAAVPAAAAGTPGEPTGDDDRPTEAVATVPAASGRAKHSTASGGRSRLVLWISAAIIAIILVGGTTAYLLAGPDEAKQVTVPSQIGQNASDAQVALQKLGFNVQIKRVPDNTVPAEQVISTIPGPDSQATEGSTVIVEVSSGPKIAAVPDVVNRSEKDARDILTKAGFTVAKDPKKEASPTVKAGDVVSTNPAVGANTPQNTPIVLTVSTGKEQVRVPDVSNTALSQAEANLKGLGFTTKVQEVDDPAPAGTVLRTTPAGGTTADKGSDITIVVSKAKAVVMPNLVGQDPSAAKAALIAMGFSESNIQVMATAPSNLPWDKNKVWKTTPDAGARVDTSASITIEVRR
ncbi:non-specific serine/threonine protein kinase OS=Tsukamurella paurometabola (strain ATCC 8368 / DSM / CCUG 35730 / CIP 100753 / JCM 10117 / KCTC 9821 / NBRC 16120 / NCIMB 702349 / NCTC 13040) OX=521096 GN=Tpau_0027 PE=4 SV=1 [Tsukamurella paurometabola]|uniref:non-specific serine/threonine protein kinase n=1 Tax=Tsukamurella paurometabola (strain ATCC 8368 / DSM 20162 / CCUG 35730 / CIP 100753 / JCM 10117 / KCTC 9821 / NBRC 16120 / NCIMB 702349 / NCTC 13040) TaxID=521096 RepID=D5UPC9_TSUPD|nr:Stk1 family PASTA domain-containing Ser/Thr kinase [Tsukamurella paurometabola]ADG76681.1 serine/threonine protein kinase with PASTA sensor(s) [Tsukamurella paurometabola DSM 20162]SUP41197.1 Serine/threonine-protein kinase pknB [Tsukamurella paurometabola]